eukprot:TRINITY_DN6629_c0_g1_i12.p1 TRINITY_DN6629_c0_g1~~TRINITY_DN6629_c0_g1_i12.p1  ORF type:complete len:279 (-),score=71.25 TRINITY_DN6629_c0_g1_i12:783-1619(-)
MYDQGRLKHDKFTHDEKTDILMYQSKQYELFVGSHVFKEVLEVRNKRRTEMYLKPVTQYQLLRITRTRTYRAFDWDDKDYPHFYALKREHDNKPIAYAVREAEYGCFKIFSNQMAEKFSPYIRSYLGGVEPNYWGTSFTIYDDGFDEKIFNQGLSLWGKLRNKIGHIDYKTNIMGEAPRDFSVFLNDFCENKQEFKLESVKPEYNEHRDCYQLNFYGRAKLASARNFQLVMPHDQDSIILMHGKIGKDEFNLDYRHPVNVIQAFSISLVSIGKKFLVA